MHEAELQPDDTSFCFQSRGALFGLDPQSECFTFASSNVASILGVGDDSDLVGRPVYNVLGRQVTHAVRNAEAHRSLHHRRKYLGIFPTAAGELEFEAFVANKHLVVDVTRPSSTSLPSAYDVLNDVEVLTEALLAADGSTTTFRRFLSLLKTMSGYHTVRLDRVGREGTQIAFTGRGEFGGCIEHCPRQLHAVQDTSCRYLSIELPADLRSSDLNLSGLCLPRANCLAELKGNDIRGYAALGLWRGKEAWGGLKFFHEDPRLPNKRTQLALAHLTPLISQHLVLIG